MTPNEKGTDAANGVPLNTGFDATVILGVAAKAAETFAEPDTFLSFPLSPIGYDASELQAMVDGASAEGLRTLSEFSGLVNQIPDGPIWSALADREHLWDVYGSILGEAQLATVSLTPAEQTRYEAARDLLGEPDESAVLTRYKQLRDAWLTARQEYRNRDGEAALAEDPAAKAQWADIDGPQLRAEIDRLMEQWTGEGQRAAVEDAQRIRAAYAERSPINAWKLLRERFDPSMPEIFLAHDPAGNTFVPTTYRPSDAATVAWPSISLTAADLERLAAQAPPALKERIGGGAETSVTAVGFEYTSVAVNRPWFAPEVFASRAWRFADDATTICDGADPPTGRCPAYVVGLILIRDLRITRKIETGHQPSPSDLGALDIQQLRPKSTSVPTVGEDRADGIQLARPRLDLVSALRLRGVTRKQLEPRTPFRIHEQSVAQLQRKDFRRVAVRLPPPPHREGPPATDQRTETRTSPAGDVFVLALICKRVGRCPDPDPALGW